jgi:hypothetical protein
MYCSKQTISLLLVVIAETCVLYIICKSYLLNYHQNFVYWRLCILACLYFSHIITHSIISPIFNFSLFKISFFFFFYWLGERDGERRKGFVDLLCRPVNEQCYS